MNEVAEINPSTWASLFTEGSVSDADPNAGTPEADPLNVSRSGLRSTNVEPGADPKIKGETSKVMGKPKAKLGPDDFVSGSQDLPKEDSPPAKAEAEVNSGTEEHELEVVRETESLDEVSNPHSEAGEPLSPPDTKEESVEGPEHEPRHTTKDSTEGNPSIPFPVVSQSLTLDEAEAATKADCDNPPLTTNEKTKVGKKQNNILFNNNLFQALEGPLGHSESFSYKSELRGHP